MSDKNSILKLYFIAAFLMLFGLAITIKLAIIQFVEGEQLVISVSEKNIKFFNVDPIRGNIYSSNGLLLATSLPKYEVRFDPVTVDSLLFFNKIDSLSQQLMNLYPNKTDKQWRKELIDARKNKSRLPITSLIDQFYAQVQENNGGRLDTSSLITLLKNTKV